MNGLIVHQTTHDLTEAYRSEEFLYPKSLTLADLLIVARGFGVDVTIDWWFHERVVDLCHLGIVHIFEVRAADQFLDRG